ncbi:hypothetical protein AAG570_004720 [Ranatra chinensis]|uniref:Uncharacterized protein n=1 Tax=Ranatra chinensis TaxID=642074 RepID=A0ABD0YJU6_9HEMI
MWPVRSSLSPLVAVVIFVSVADCLVESSSVSCAVRKEISPCTCQNKPFISQGRTVDVSCERMTSFEQVLDAVKKKFEPDVQINMKISYSTLDDLPQMSFNQMGLKIFSLDLNDNNITSLPESVFMGMGQWAEHLGLSNNPLGAVPHSVLALMPRLKVLDLQRANITNITSADFQGLASLRNLLLKENEIELLEEDSLPTKLHKLQLGGNRIKSLNGTVRKMSELEWLIINHNRIESLDGELPCATPNDKLQLLVADDNQLVSLPDSMHNFKRLDYANFHRNNITSLNRTLAKNRLLTYLNLEANHISTLVENEFSDLEQLKDILLGWNRIEWLNGSLVPLKTLRTLNLTHNAIGHFSFQELAGLTQLKMVDLSHNDMHTLTSRTQNQVESEVRIVELRLQFNKLSRLSGALSGLSGLNRLNLSHNLIEVIQPNDLIGLDDLKILDVSYNKLLTLEETSKTLLPRLEELRASHNAIRVLEHDFYGLPRLCWADLSHNDILTVDPTLTDNTRCQLHGVNSTLRIYLHGE